MFYHIFCINYIYIHRLFTKVLEEKLCHTEKYKFYLPALSAFLDTDLPRGISIMHERGSGPTRGVIIPNDPTTSKGWPQHRGLQPLLFSNSDVGSFTSHKNKSVKVPWDGTYWFSSLSEKTEKSNHLQMSLQRQHFLQAAVRLISACYWVRRDNNAPAQVKRAVQNWFNSWKLLNWIILYVKQSRSKTVTAQIFLKWLTWNL